MTHARHHESAPYQIFMLLLSVFVLVSLAAETLTDLDPEVSTILLYADTAVCGIFLLDFIMSLTRAPDRKRYFVTWGWIDLLSSIPAISVLRWGRAARVLRILRVLRGVRAARILGGLVAARRGQTVVLGAVLVSILSVVVASIAVLQFERPAGGNIETGVDALWWSFVTVTTVGYGDSFPVTVEGRLVATVLMTVGVCLIGALAAYLASWFIEPEEHEQDQALAEIRRELSEIRSLLERRVS